MRLDPRTKLLMLAVFSIVMIDGDTEGINFFLKPALAVLPLILLLLNGKKKAALGYLTVFVLSWTGNLLLVPQVHGGLKMLVSLVTQLGTRWFPSGMLGYYLITTTQVSEFVAAMQKMHVSEKIIIPFSVMFRFFPTVSEEASAISCAMRMRGIGLKGVTRNPAAVLEYRLVPLMISVVNIGNELSAAALTRGLGNMKKRTSACRIGFGAADFLFAAIVVGGLAVFIIF